MNFVYALTGGIIIGLAAALMHLALGRVAGVSGILGSLLHSKPSGQSWRIAFVAGLLIGGALWFVSDASRFSTPPVPTAQVILAGLLVGFGAQLGSGCTSGHGVCGLSRFSTRSAVATISFVFTGIATVALF